MWTKHRSFFLLILIKQKQKIRLFIPLALPVLDVTLASLRDSLDFWEGLFPDLFRRMMSQDKGESNKKLKLTALFTLFINLIRELRSYGSYEIVQVEDDKYHISIRLC